MKYSHLRPLRLAILALAFAGIAGFGCSSTSSKRSVISDAGTGLDGGKSAVKCTVTVTGFTHYSGPCRIFVCSPVGMDPSIDLIADFGDAGSSGINFIGNSATVGKYNQASYPGGWNTVANRNGLQIRNDASSPGPGVSLSTDITSVTFSTDPNDVCSGTVTGTVKGDIVVVGDSGTPQSAHFEFTMK